MRGIAAVLAALFAGCLSAPPSSVDRDADVAGVPDASQGKQPDAGCPALPPLAPFADDFSTNALAWAVDPHPGRSGAGTIVMDVMGGALSFTPTADGDAYAWLQTSSFDFTSGRIAVRVPTLTTDATSLPYFGIIGEEAQDRVIHFDGSSLAGPNGGSVAYDPVRHLWWQVLSDGGILRFQVSPDGVAWEDIDAGEAGFALDAVLFEVGINVDAAGAANRGTFVLDDLDLPPCR